MADYSVSPLDLLTHNQQKGYVGLHIEQGVPLLDRDLNLLHDLVAATLRSVITRYIGNGIPAGTDGFAIQAIPAAQNFRIKASAGGSGACLVGGIEVVIGTETTYTAQPDMAPLTTPTPAQPDPRVDIVYLDVFLNEVDASGDPNLANSQDLGIQTSVRLKPAWVVRVAEGVAVPSPAAGHAHYPLAQLRRPRGEASIDAGMITDLRQARLTVSDMERRLALMERLLMVPAFVEPPLPQFFPKSGAINQAITLNGANFNVGTVQVKFGDKTAKIVGGASATQVVARVPPGLTPAGTPVGVKVTVENPGGSDISTDTFTVLPAPTFADPTGQFTPNHGLPGQQVTINGFNFNAGGAQVKFDNTTATIVGTPTNTQIVVLVPTGLVPAGGTTADVKITVTTGAGSVVSDETFHAEINIPAPSFVVAPTPQFLPKSGVGGQTITLNGQNFNFGPVSVKFENRDATVTGTPTATAIATVVPSGMIGPGATPKGVKITVTTAGGSVVSADTFTVTGP
jgi:IPT/TIG domain